MLKEIHLKEVLDLVLTTGPLQSSSARRTEIVSIIEDLKHGFEPDKFDADPRCFDLINRIYNIAIYRDAKIAQVYPEDKIFESGFFEPSDFMEISEFRMWVTKNLG